jgi:hypothetical protein
LAEIASISKIDILKLAAGLFEPCSLPHRWVARNLRKYIYIFTPCIFSTRSIRVNGLTTMLFSGRRKKNRPKGLQRFQTSKARNAIFSALGKVPAIWLKVERKNRTKNTNRTERLSSSLEIGDEMAIATKATQLLGKWRKLRR